MVTGRHVNADHSTLDKNLSLPECGSSPIGKTFKFENTAPVDEISFDQIDLWSDGDEQPGQELWSSRSSQQQPSHQPGSQPHGAILWACFTVLIHSAHFTAHSHCSFSLLIHKTVLVIIINRELSLPLHLLPASI